MKDLDREVLAHLAEDLLLLLLDDLPGPRMGVDDVVADHEVDALASRVISASSMSGAVSVGMVSSFIGVRPDAGRPSVSRNARSCLQVTVHEVDLLEDGEGPSRMSFARIFNAVDRLQLGVGRGKDFVQPAELPDDVLHHQLREPGMRPRMR